jgi:hypothetical protein
VGHSISVTVRSQRLKEAMFGLLADLYHPWPEIVDEDGPPAFWGPLIDDLACSQGKCLIGWDHQPVDGPERLYNFSLIRWIAIRVGRKQKRFRGDNLSLNRPVPYWVQDGERACPICPDGGGVLVPTGVPLYDRYGLPIGPKAAQELSWHYIPDVAHGVISATHHGKPLDEIQQALMNAGMPGALASIRVIRSEIAKLDVLWEGLEV